MPIVNNTGTGHKYLIGMQQKIRLVGNPSLYSILYPVSGRIPENWEKAEYRYRYPPNMQHARFYISQITNLPEKPSYAVVYVKK